MKGYSSPTTAQDVMNGEMHQTIASGCGSKVASCGNKVASCGNKVASCGSKVASCGTKNASCGSKITASCGSK